MLNSEQITLCREIDRIWKLKEEGKMSREEYGQRYTELEIKLHSPIKVKNPERFVGTGIVREHQAMLESARRLNRGFAKLIS